MGSRIFLAKVLMGGGVFSVILFVKVCDLEKKISRWSSVSGCKE
jgi:hypothetical protein